MGDERTSEKTTMFNEQLMSLTNTDSAFELAQVAYANEIGRNLFKKHMRKEVNE